MSDTPTVPQDMDAERAILGAMCLTPAACELGLSRLEADAFMLPQHRVIFAAMARLRGHDVPVDLVTLRNELTRNNDLDAAGGVDLITELAESVPSTVNAEHYAGIVLKHHRSRKLLLIGRELQQDASEPGCDPAELATRCAGELARSMANDPTGAGSEAVMRCMADVEPRQVQWLWPGRIPLGRLTLLVGKPGEGKSYLAVDIAARVTTGRPWPDGAACPSGSVILVCAEDDPADTIRPRLDAHLADVQRVQLLAGVRRMGRDGQQHEALFTLADVTALEAALKAHPDCKLIVVDPIGSFLGGNTDAHRDNEVRAVLAPVARMAEQYGAAVLVIAHRRKGSGNFADDLAIGSRAFTGIARAVWHLSRGGENKTRRLLLPGKNNLAPEGTGLAFSISGDPPVVGWESEPVRMSADDALAFENGAGQHEKPGPEAHARNAAADWLRELLASGPAPAATVKTEAADAGYSWRTVQRAADAIGVIRHKGGFDGGWTWELPAEDAKPTCHTPQDGGNLASWHLRNNGPEYAVSACQAAEDATLKHLGTLDGDSSPKLDQLPPVGIPPKVWATIQQRKAAAAHRAAI